MIDNVKNKNAGFQINVEIFNVRDKLPKQFAKLIVMSIKNLFSRKITENQFIIFVK